VAIGVISTKLIELVTSIEWEVSIGTLKALFKLISIMIVTIVL